MKNCARPVIHRIQGLRPVVDCSRWLVRCARASPRDPSTGARALLVFSLRPRALDRAHLNGFCPFPPNVCRGNADRTWQRCGGRPRCAARPGDWSKLRRKSRCYLRACVPCVVATCTFHVFACLSRTCTVRRCFLTAVLPRVATPCGSQEATRLRHAQQRLAFAKVVNDRLAGDHCLLHSLPLEVVRLIGNLPLRQQWADLCISALEAMHRRPTQTGLVDVHVAHNGAGGTELLQQAAVALQDAGCQLPYSPGHRYDQPLAQQFASAGLPMRAGTEHPPDECSSRDAGRDAAAEAVRAAVAEAVMAVAEQFYFEPHATAELMSQRREDERLTREKRELERECGYRCCKYCCSGDTGLYWCCCRCNLTAVVRSHSL